MPDRVDPRVVHPLTTLTLAVKEGRLVQTVAIVCYCPRCDYFLKTAVQTDTVGTHWCAGCDGQMEVYIAQGTREVVVWHRG